METYISLRRLSYFWDKVKEYISKVVRNTISPSSEKEVVNVLTASATAPTGVEDAYYINKTENILYVCEQGQWNAVAASEDCIYVTEDTSRIYAWRGTEGFVEITGDAIDDTIHVMNITTDLEDYTTSGLYKVALVNRLTKSTVYYTMVVSTTRGKTLIGKPIGSGIAYKQMLTHESGWMVRTKQNDGAWGEWTEHTYAYEEDIQEATTEEIDALFE